MLTKERLLQVKLIDRTVVGVNWYVTKTVKFMANYSSVSMDNQANPGGTTEDLDSVNLELNTHFNSLSPNEIKPTIFDSRFLGNYLL